MENGKKVEYMQSEMHVENIRNKEPIKEINIKHYILLNLHSILKYLLISLKLLGSIIFIMSR